MSDQAGGGQDEHNADQHRDESRGSGTSRPAAGSGTSGSGGRQASRSRQGGPGQDMLTDFQRWLIRSSAKNMRKQVESQVRRTLGGRNDSSDVWDTATTEIPPEVGESPECQWCPVCRAARRMRESNTDIGGHLSTASDVVASAVQEAMRAFDSVVARASRGETRSKDGNGWTAAGGDWSSGRDSWAAAHGGQPGAFPDEEDQAARDAAADGEDDEPEGSDEPHDRG